MFLTLYFYANILASADCCLTSKKYIGIQNSNGRDYLKKNVEICNDRKKSKPKNKDYVLIKDYCIERPINANFAEIHLKSFKRKNAMPLYLNDIFDEEILHYEDSKKKCMNDIETISESSQIVSINTFDDGEEIDNTDSLEERNFDKDSLEIYSPKETDIDEDSLETSPEINDKSSERLRNNAEEMTATCIYGVHIPTQNLVQTQAPYKKSTAFIIPLESDEPIYLRNNKNTKDNLSDNSNNTECSKQVFKNIKKHSTGKREAEDLYSFFKPLPALRDIVHLYLNNTNKPIITFNSKFTEKNQTNLHNSEISLQDKELHFQDVLVETAILDKYMDYTQLAEINKGNINEHNQNNCANLFSLENESYLLSNWTESKQSELFISLKELENNFKTSTTNRFNSYAATNTVLQGGIYEIQKSEVSLIPGEFLYLAEKDKTHDSERDNEIISVVDEIQTDKKTNKIGILINPKNVFQMKDITDGYKISKGNDLATLMQFRDQNLSKVDFEINNEEMLKQNISNFKESSKHSAIRKHSKLKTVIQRTYRQYLLKYLKKPKSKIKKKIALAIGQALNKYASCFHIGIENFYDGSYTAKENKLAWFVGTESIETSVEIYKNKTPAGFNALATNCSIITGNNVIVSNLEETSINSTNVIVTLPTDEPQKLLFKNSNPVFKALDNTGKTVLLENEDGKNGTEELSAVIKTSVPFENLQEFGMERCSILIKEQNENNEMNSIVGLVTRSCKTEEVVKQHQLLYKGDSFNLSSDKERQKITFEEHGISLMDNLLESKKTTSDSEDESIVVHHTYNVETRNSSALSDSLIIGQVFYDEYQNEKFVNALKPPFKRHCTYDSDIPQDHFEYEIFQSGLPRSHKITNINDSSLDLDEITTENIRLKMLASSLTAAEPNILKSNMSKQINSHNKGTLLSSNISTTLTGTVGTSTDTESAIIVDVSKMSKENEVREIQTAFLNNGRINQMDQNEAAARRMAFQRGNALRNDSIPDEKQFYDSEDEQQNIFKRKLKLYSNDYILKWLSRRQNSMPVQIDSEIFRVIPKHMRKRIKSAEGYKTQNEAFYD